MKLKCGCHYQNLTQRGDRMHDLIYSQWISCTDILPEYGEAVLTINEDEDYEINHIIDEDNGEWFYEGAIAWMPLPEPPKER